MWRIKFAFIAISMLLNLSCQKADDNSGKNTMAGHQISDEFPESSYEDYRKYLFSKIHTNSDGLPDANNVQTVTIYRQAVMELVEQLHSESRDFVNQHFKKDNPKIRKILIHEFFKRENIGNFQDLYEVFAQGDKK